VAQKFTTPITIRDLSSASSDSIAVSLSGDTNDRFKIEAGGRIVWGTGSSAGDVNLYRDASNALKTDDTFEAAAGVITLTTAGTPTATIADGALAVDTTNDILYFRSGSSWVQVSGTGTDHGTLAGLGDDDHTIYLLADGTRTATELTISGDLTVDTDTLYVDSANNRVGIGTTTPTVALDVTGNAFISQDAEVDGILTANHIHGNIAGSVYIHVKNTSGSTIAAGTPVYATGSVGASGATEVSPSDASTSSTMPALGITQVALANNAEGHATVLGVVGGLNTSAYAVNTTLYVAPGGGLTSTRPTSSSDLVQAIARVVRTDSSTGELLVLGAGRTNDIPNDITLGTDTIGDYVESLVAGTGITLSNNSGEGATPTIEIGQAVGTTDSVTFSDVTVSGNLTVSGSTTTVDTATLSVEDPLIILASGNNTADVVDIGFYGLYDTSGSQDLYAGLFRDATDGKFKLFKDSQSAPTSTVDTGASGYSVADLVANVEGNLTGTADSANTLSTSRTISLSGDVVGSVSFDGSANVSISTTIQADSVALGTDTTGDYVESLVAGTGVSLLNNTGEGATPTIYIGQDVGTGASVTFGHVSADLTGSITGDVYASNGTSKVLDNGTNGTDATFIGAVTGTVSDISNHDLGDLGDVNFTIVTPAQGDVVYYDGAEWVNFPLSIGDVGGVNFTTSPTTGDFLKFNGTDWVPDAIDLGTDTTGDYVESLVAGTGVTLSNNTGEGATPTVAIGQAVAASDDVTFNTVTGTNGVVTLTTAGTPTATIADGAIAVDTTNDLLYFRSGSTWQQVTGGGGASVTVSDGAPSSPSSGDLWYESDTGSMFVYYDDGDTQQWVEVGGSSVVAMTVSDTPPSTPSNGDMWFESDTGKTYVYYTDGTSSQWVEVGAAASAAAYVEVSDTAPSAPDNGTLWYDSTTSALLVYYNDGSSAQWIEVIGDSVVAMTTSDTAPSSPTNGDLWFESDTGRTYLYYDDGTSGQWVEVGAAGGVASTVATSQPATANTGDIWYDSDDAELFIYNGSTWVSAGGGALVTVSDTDPAGPSEGDMWFESDTGRLLVYYDSSWVEVGGTGSVNPTITSSSTDAAILLMEIGP